MVLTGCWSEDTQELRPLLSEGKADLLVILKQGATPREIRAFDEAFLIVGDLELGHDLRPGIRTIVETRVAGQAAFAIEFFSDASNRQRQDLLGSLESSELVHTILKDVAPESVTVVPPA